ACALPISRTGSGAAAPHGSAAIPDPAPVPPGLNDETPAEPGSESSDVSNPAPVPPGQKDSTPADRGSGNAGSNARAAEAAPRPKDSEGAPRAAERAPTRPSDPAPKSD